MLKLPWYHNLLIKILKSGPVPKHIAIITDGHRRYSKRHSIEKKDGHFLGFYRCLKILYFAHLLEIKEITILGLSVEDFKRSPEEIENLINLTTRKISKHMDFLKVLNVKIRYFGNLQVIPQEVLADIREIEEATSEHSKIIFNIGFAYSSRDEIVEGLKVIQSGLENGDLLENDVDEGLISKVMMVDSNPDLVIRAAEFVIDDFMLWQLGDAHVYFFEKYWPEFDFISFARCIIVFQRNYNNRVVIYKNCVINCRVQRFLKKIGLQS